jgi:delta 1-pyrroline-5-carboxylate dehydrogenase
LLLNAVSATASRPVSNPANLADIVGSVTEANAQDVQHALQAQQNTRRNGCRSTGTARCSLKKLQTVWKNACWTSWRWRYAKPVRAECHR